MQWVLRFGSGFFGGGGRVRGGHALAGWGAATPGGVVAGDASGVPGARAGADAERQQASERREERGAWHRLHDGGLLGFGR